MGKMNTSKLTFSGLTSRERGYSLPQAYDKANSHHYIAAQSSSSMGYFEIAN